MAVQSQAPFGTLLRHFRLGAGVSQETLAERAGLSVKTVAALETGARRAPYQRTVAMLADALLLPKKARARLAAAAIRPYRPSTVRRLDHTPRHNLPAQLSSFVGRKDVVAAVVALVANHRLVTLTGTGGIGKTRIALQVAGRHVPSWPDGVWFVDLAPLEDAARVVERTAAVLGLDAADDGPTSEALAAGLGGRHLLLILDNCEHVIADVARLVGTVLPACPRISVLATSRQRLNVPGERVFDVHPLAVPETNKPAEAQECDAVRLFVERARDTASFALEDDGTRVVADICRRLDGIPLAIELAAARVRDLSVHDIALHLDERFRILVGGARSAVPRQQTMRATLDWSVDALSPPQHALFRRVGIFADGWTLNSASGICRDEDDTLLDALERMSSLVEASLVIADTARIRTRYRLLESTRLYALEQLDASAERRDVAARHAGYFASFCDEAREAAQTTQFAPWLGWVGEELENVRAALAWALSDDGDTTVALRLANGLGPFWVYAGLSQEGRRWLEAALERGNDGVDPKILACAWRNLASLKRGTGSLEAAQRAVALDERGGDSLAASQSRQIRALSLIYVGRLTEAEADINYAILLLRDLGMLGTIAHARALNSQAFVLAEQGRLDEARGALEASLGIYTDCGDELHVAIVQSNLAELAFYAGDFRQAMKVAHVAGISWSQVGNFAGQSMMLADEAAYCLALGDVPGARETARNSLVLAQRGQLVDVLFSALQHLAAVAALNGDVRRAALLVGYVDFRNRARGYRRELIERRSFDILMTALDAVLPLEQRAELILEGEELDEEAAIELALGIS